MIWQQRLDELSSYIAALERDLAEVDSLVATHRHSLDDTPRENWPKGSILEKALCRHELRLLKEASMDCYQHGRVG